MQLFSSSQAAWSSSSSAFASVAPFAPLASRGSGSAAARSRPPAAARSTDTGPCGWYDSSLDLLQGLEVSEHDNDTLYQLWELSRK